jgi:hypothetical protein
VPTKPYLGSWKYRRRVVFGTLIYCAAMIAYMLVRGTDSALYQQAVIALAGLAGAVIGSYVFAAVWDDKSIRKDGGP